MRTLFPVSINFGFGLVYFAAVMAKSKSQRMKEYRARKKEQLGDRWLLQENRRVKNYYVPTSYLNEDSQGKRREQNKRNARRFYQKRKHTETADSIEAEAGQNNLTTEPGPSTSADDNGISSTTNENLLTVKMQFVTKKDNRKSVGKKRVSRALAKSYRRIKTVEYERDELKRKLDSAQRRIHRFGKQKNTPLTPKSKANTYLKNAGLNPNKVPSIRKQLVYAECLNEEVKEAIAKNSKNKHIVQKVVSGKIMKKYRMQSVMERSTNLNRRKNLANKDMRNEKKRILKTKADIIMREVTEFLGRDDNSRVLPGKADAVKIGANKKQKRVLNDYLHNLHLKFTAESTCSVSLATFCRLRPPFICLVNFASRSVCLCSKHQNFGFKLRCLKNMKVSLCTSPDKFVDEFKDEPKRLEEMLMTIPSERVKYQQWKRVKTDNGKERMRIIDVEVSKADFIELMKKEFIDFVGHVSRVTDQYASIKKMKDTLPANHALVQMDFSENYNCQTMEEIQSAYWNASMVTLHPTVLYFKTTDNELQHKSLVFVSEVLHHNAAMVSVIVKKIVEQAKRCVPDLKGLHFWTDSPSSQYRNKSLFDIVKRFELLYGCRASWHYFESGHGKGPCDGVGGTTKRNADNAIKQGKAVIQDANDFFAWAIQSQGEIEYQMITPKEYEQSSQYIEQRKQEIKPLKGTMALHAVTVGSDDELMVRNTTCACEQCFGVNGFSGTSDCGWTRGTLNCVTRHNEAQTLDTDQNKAKHADNQTNTDQTQSKHTEKENITISEHDYVVALYEQACYIGKILEMDKTDDTVHITFMTNTGKVEKRYRWPAREDTVWVQRQDVLRLIENPIPTGKSGRIYSVDKEVTQFIEGYKC